MQTIEIIDPVATNQSKTLTGHPSHRTEKSKVNKNVQRLRSLAVKTMLCHLLPVALFLSFLMVPAACSSRLALLNVSTLLAAPGVTDVAVDSHGRLVVNNNNGVVYRIAPNGTNTTLASGLNHPFGITLDTETDVAYVADSGHCIKSVTSDGNTTSIAGRCDYPGNVNGIGTTARFNNPKGIVFHAGVLYVCDAVNRAIRKINITTLNVTTVVARAPLSSPFYLCINRAGTTLYVTTYSNHLIFRVDLVPTTPTMTIIAGSSGNVGGYVDGVSSDARLNGPLGIALLPDETMLYVAERFNYCIRSIRLSDGYVSTVAGTGIVGYQDGPPMTAQFGAVYGIKWYCTAPNTDQQCDLLVADYGNAAMRTVSTSAPSHTATVLLSEQSVTSSLPFEASATFSAPTATDSTGTETVMLTSITQTTTLYTNTTTRDEGCSLSVSTSQSVASASPQQTTTATQSTATGTPSVPPRGTETSSGGLLTSSTQVISKSLDVEPTHTITAVVPMLTIETALRHLQGGIAAATPVLQYTFGAVSTSAGRISRMGAVSKIGSCLAPFAPPQGLLSLRIEGCGENDGMASSAAAEYARGDVVLALVVLLCVVGLLLVCCFLYSHALHMPFQESAAALSMPSLLLPLWGAALPTSVGGMVALGRNWEGCVGDGVLLVFGAVVVVVLPVVMLMLGTVVMLKRLHIVRRVSTAAVLKDNRCAPLQHIVDVAVYRQWAWEPHCGAATLAHLYAAAW